MIIENICFLFFSHKYTIKDEFCFLIYQFCLQCRGGKNENNKINEKNARKPMDDF